MSNLALFIRQRTAALQDILRNAACCLSVKRKKSPPPRQPSFPALLSFFILKTGFFPLGSLRIKNFQPPREKGWKS